MKQLLFLVFMGMSVAGNTQTMRSKSADLQNAAGKLEPSFIKFDEVIENGGLDDGINTLVRRANTEADKFIVSNYLYNIDTTASYKLGKEAYTADSSCIEFIFGYARQLQRKGRYADAARLYEKCMQETPSDLSGLVWLTDCYMNIGKDSEALATWDSANYVQHHTAIDKAIWAIYGKATLYRMRDSYRKEVAEGKTAAIFPLIMQDMMWELDWWNFTSNEKFLNADMRLAKSKCSSDDYDLLMVYTKVKKLSANEANADSIRMILEQHGLLLGAGKLPKDGNIASDLLRICFMYHLLTEMPFYNLHGEEVHQAALKTKDKDLLNIYAYLQANVYGKVDPLIDKMGWTDFKDERFAVSYFIGKKEKNRSDDPELQQALRLFPRCSALYWILTNCAKNEKKAMRPYLTELIKREFRTLGSDPDKFGNSLNAYMGFLATEK